MRKYITVILMTWLTAGFISLSWNLYHEKKERETTAFQNARTFLTQLVQTRTWNARHGGVYVPVGPDVQPNPFLDDPERDLTTEKGLQLTKINPAFMTRQLAEIAAEQSGARFHITSLAPIRPENQAADWERKWLKDFQDGAKERGSFITTPNGIQFRYMAPLFVRNECMQCHAKQDYKLGDIRGGISITLPMDVPVFNWKMLISHLLAMAVGVGCILFFGARLIENRNTLIAACTNLENEVHERKQAQKELQETRDQLEERVQERTAELSQEVQQRARAEKALELSEKRFRLALDASSDGVWDWNLIDDKVYYGTNWHRLLGYTDDDMKTTSLSWDTVMHPDDMEKTMVQLEEHIKGRTNRYEIEFRMKRKDGGWQWILSRGKIVEWDQTGKPSRFIGTNVDIARLKNVEKELQNAYSKLDRKVRERTKELEETNIALKVLLQKRNESKKILEQQILDNVTDLIEPYLSKLEKMTLTADQQVLIDILETNIKEITSPFSRDLSLNFTKLTPAEVQVANLVKQGKRTKDIGLLLNLSPGTISIHRKNIRKKLGLTNQRINLQSFLASYSH